MKSRSKAITLGCALVYFAALGVAYGADVKKGKQIFEDHACAKCHAVTPQKTANPGPSLAGIARTRDQAWLKKFIQDPAQFKSDPEIQAEMKKFPTGMPVPKLSEPETADLLAYLDQLK